MRNLSDGAAAPPGGGAGGGAGAGGAAALAHWAGGRAPPRGGGRVRGGELRVLVLDALELVEEPVVLRVGHVRVVQHVVAVVVVGDLLAQLGGPAFDVLRGHQCPSR